MTDVVAKVIETGHDGTTYRVRVCPEQDAVPSPRESACVGRMVLRHRTRDLPWEGPDHIAEGIDLRLSDSTFGGTAEDRLSVVTEWLRSDHGVAHVVPVWLYEHGDSTMRAAERNPFTCPWDTGLVGVIYAPADHGVPDSASLGQLLSDEVAVYDQWARGEVYRYEVHRQGVSTGDLARAADRYERERSRDAGAELLRMVTAYVDEQPEHGGVEWFPVDEGTECYSIDAAREAGLHSVWDQ